MTSMVAVSNTTSIIYLARISKLDILRNLYSTVYVCSPVLSDIDYLIQRGRLTADEVHPIEEARSGGWITLRDPEGQEALSLKGALVDQGLGVGEAYSIALAREMGAVFLANDKQAIELARGCGVETRWFTEILHDVLRAGAVTDMEEYTRMLDACRAKGLYVSRGERERAVSIAQKIAVEKHS